MMGACSLDGLMIGTRCNLHAPYAVEAARYDVPLFLEKPVAVSMDQAIALERAYESSACSVLVSFPLRLSPLCSMTRRLIDEGAVGRCEHVLATNYVPYGTCYWEQGYRDYAVTGGLFLQKATHDFDYLMFLLATPIVRIAATAHYGGVFSGDRPDDLLCSACEDAGECLESPQMRKRNHSGGALTDHRCVFSTGKENEDASSALLEFGDGAHGVYTQVFFSRREAGRRGAVVSGYQGTIDMDWYRNDIRRVRHHQPFSDTIAAPKGMSHFGGDAELARSFLSMIRGGAESPAGIREGIQSVYACLAARESAQTAAFVDVRQFGQVSGSRSPS
jgi:predicted dehydrogenase